MAVLESKSEDFKSISEQHAILYHEAKIQDMFFTHTRPPTFHSQCTLNYMTLKIDYFIKHR